MSEDRLPADLIENWMRGRSLVRGLPQPVRHPSGALRLDTNSAGERCRYLFAQIDRRLSDLAETIEAGDVLLKICGSANEARAYLPSRWVLTSDTFVMTAPKRVVPVAPAASAGYSIAVERTGVVANVRIHADDGTLTASGHAAEAHGVFVYDRIRTEPGHRRRGLGRIMMRTLAALRKGPATEILVATAEGRSLYEAMGWGVRSPYVTAVIPIG